ncbi:adhesion G protein-coupled receptor F5 isoform X2 [Amia ocellicauda]|uniref:adhesion G protein-coupled receptor F5 isoform X2 n=1 Tax=Amia ocellicauda TaxID=2972642 RepID=UPI003463EBEE
MAIFKILFSSTILLLISELSRTETLIPDHYSLPVNDAEENGVSKPPAHFRKKRAAAASKVDYIIDIEVDATNIIIDQLRSVLVSLTYPLDLDADINITNVAITTVCSPNGQEIWCTCDNNYIWAPANCTQYQPCSNSTQNSCECIKALPPDGLYCQPKPECSDLMFGQGNQGSTSVSTCGENYNGNITAQCTNGTWIFQKNTCVLKPITNILSTFQLSNQPTQIVQAQLPVILETINNVSTILKDTITNSTESISSIVKILSILSIASENITVNTTVMTNFLGVLNIILDKTAVNTWSNLNSGNDTKNQSSNMLLSVERFIQSFSANESVNITTDNIELQSTIVPYGNYNSAFQNLNTSGQINIPGSELEANTTVNSIAFKTLSDILPTRTANNTNDTKISINGIVMSVNVKSMITDVSLGFGLKNTSLVNPICVFWNFSLYDTEGGWDSSGCQFQSKGNGSVTCVCNHLTSFSILMSPSIPEAYRLLLDFITYIGVGISMLSLILCLIIEAFVWTIVTKNSISYMRHVSIVNIAVSLLIADTWFLIGSAIAGTTKETPVPACSAATFFIHFFYLALFFWMLTSALLLFYRTIMIFSHLSKAAMLAIGFSLGYGCPLIIAVVTVAATVPQSHYIMEKACWLNWNDTKALLAFVIPALTIVAINLLILIVVIFKMLRRGVGETNQSDEKNALIVIVRCIAILTPFFGLTWGFGIGLVVNPESIGLHVVFAVLNSLQGFFILVFGTLLDSKIRAAVFRRFSFVTAGSQQTRSTSAGNSSSGNRFRNRFRRRNVFNVADLTSTSQSATDSLVNT